MKNRQFIVFMVCFGVYGFFFVTPKLIELINRDDFERNLGCASLRVDYEKFLRESDYVENGYAVYTMDVNVFYSKAIKDCVASYETVNREPDGTRYNFYVIENYFSKDTIFSCNNTEDKTGLLNTDCYSKRDEKRLELK